MTAVLGKAKALYIRAGDLALFGAPLALLFARFMVAREFWRSGLTKVETVELLGLRLPTPHIKQSTFFLFDQVFFPGLDKAVTDILTIFAAIGELTLPLLVMFGFLTRFGALGLLIMTLVIQVFVMPQAWWSPHAWWVVALLPIIAMGPGALSIDRLIGLEPKRG